VLDDQPIMVCLLAEARSFSPFQIITLALGPFQPHLQQVLGGRSLSLRSKMAGEWSSPVTSM